MSNVSNLQYVKTTDNYNQEVDNSMRIATLNAMSDKNKDHLIAQQLHETEVDLAVITETWLKDTDTDKAWLNQSEHRQSNYDILLQNKPGPKKGGGIALMYKHQYSNDITTRKDYNINNGLLSLQTHPQKQTQHIIALYHPPPSTDNQTTTSTFINKITSLLTERITNLNNIMVLGDFNINTRETTNADNTIFNDTMAVLRLEQHIHSPTHRLRPY